MAHFGISRFEVRPEGTISTTMVGATGLEPLPRVTGRRSPFKIVAGYLTWQGKMVENNGITPKSAIELSREASRSERDTQLEAAVKSREHVAAMLHITLSVACEFRAAVYHFRHVN